MQSKANKCSSDFTTIEKKSSKTGTQHVVRKPKSDDEFEEEEIQAESHQKVYPPKAAQQEKEPRKKSNILRGNMNTTGSGGRNLMASQMKDKKDCKLEPADLVKLLTPKSSSKPNVPDKIVIEETPDRALNDSKAGSLLKTNAEIIEQLAAFSDEDDSSNQAVSDVEAGTSKKPTLLGPMLVTKQDMTRMKQRHKSFSKILATAQRLTPADFAPLPTQFDYDDRGTLERLLATELNRTITSDHSPFEQPKWGKPHPLNTLNNGKRRQVAKAPPTSPRSQSPGLDIIDDSPPVATTSRAKHFTRGQEPKSAWNLDKKFEKVDINDRDFQDDIVMEEVIGSFFPKSTRAIF